MVRRGNAILAGPNTTASPGRALAPCRGLAANIHNGGYATKRLRIAFAPGVVAAPCTPHNAVKLGPLCWQSTKGRQRLPVPVTLNCSLPHSPKINGPKKISKNFGGFKNDFYSGKLILVPVGTGWDQVGGNLKWRKSGRKKYLKKIAGEIKFGGWGNAVAWKNRGINFGSRK